MPTIDVIANQCPFTGGNAVFRARGIMTLWNDTIDFNDDELCAEVGARFGHYTKPSIPVLVEFYPNPTSGLVTMDYDLANISEATLEISNTLGQIVFTRKLNSSADIIPLDLSALYNGIYHFVITNGNSIIKGGRISIIK